MVVCLVWVIGVPLYYVVTLDQSIVEGIPHSFVHITRGVVPRELALLFFLFGQFVMVPFGLVLGVRLLWRRVHARAWRGVVAGLVFWLWASTLLFSVPYLGGYPNLPGLVIALLVVGDPSAGSSFYLTVLGANAVIYPLAGARMLHRKLPNPPGTCRRCAYDLTGNVSGVCPECGTAIQQATKRDDPTTPADGA